MGTARTRANNKFNHKTYERLYPFVPIGHKAEIEAAAKATDESLNTFIIKAIDERICNLQGRKVNSPYKSEEVQEAIKKLRLKGDGKE